MQPTAENPQSCLDHVRVAILPDGVEHGRCFWRGDFLPDGMAIEMRSLIAQGCTAFLRAVEAGGLNAPRQMWEPDPVAWLRTAAPQAPRGRDLPRTPHRP